MLLWLLCTPALAHAQRAISWSTLANQLPLGDNESATVTCPGNGRTGQVWGTDTYTDDSSVCSAAVHAGLITRNEGGTFVLRRRPGLPTYQGTVRNGVSSSDYGPWDSSFSLAAAGPPPVVRALGREVAAPALPARVVARPEVIPWSRTAARLAPNGARFTFVCPAHGVAAAISGTELYSWDSSICTAAVHAGAITFDRGGMVTVEMKPGAASYPGTARHGVTSVNGKRSTLGFVVIRNDTERL